ncbi:transposase, partial [Streptomyces tateyamensis]
EAVLDQYQVRKYAAWHRHITMSMLALCLLAVMRQALQKGAPALGKTFRNRPDGPSGTS